MESMQADEGRNSAKNENASENDDQDAQTMPPDINAVSRLLATSNVVYVAAVVFAALSTFGIVYFGNKYARLKELELANYKREVDLKIADANRNAAEANALAAAARADADAARAEQEKFKKERVQLEISLREVEQSYSKVMATNAASREKIQKLEEAAKARTISPTQEVQIANLLKNFAGQEVEVRLYAQEHEAQVFASQVAKTLNKAGLKTQLNTMLGATGQGFGVAVHDEESAPTLATTILFAFRSAGVPTDGVRLPDVVEKGKFFIIVGAKPIAILPH
jgi:hypothetical protein